MSFRVKSCFVILSSAFVILFFSVFVFAQSNFVASISLNQDGRNCNALSSSITVLNQINATGNCFSFSASNIFLDCANFEIVGNGSGIGVNITGRENITIRNCVFSNFTFGIDGNNASHNSIINVTTINVTNIFTSGSVAIENSSGINSTNLVVSNANVGIVDSVTGSFNFTNANLSIIRTNSAELNFTSPITGVSTASLDSIAVITNESIKVNVVSANFLNTTAHLVFFPQNFTDIEAKVDFDDVENFSSCPASVCLNAAQSGSVFEYDVAHFTSFSFGASPQPGPGPSPSPPPSGGGGGSGGAGAKPKIPVDLEVLPDSIESFLKAGESKEFVIEIRNGLNKRDVEIKLEGPEFMFLNEDKKAISLTLPTAETWRILLTVSLPEDALGIYLGKIIITGTNLKKEINVRIVAGTGIIMKYEPEEDKDDLLETKLQKRDLEKPSLLRQKIQRVIVPKYSSEKSNITAGMPWPAIGVIALFVILVAIAILISRKKLVLRHIGKMIIRKKRNSRISVYKKEINEGVTHHNSNDGHVKRYVEELVNLAIPPLPPSKQKHPRLPPPIDIVSSKNSSLEHTTNSLKELIDVGNGSIKR